jgi:hypothetical protein
MAGMVAAYGQGEVIKLWETRPRMQRQRIRRYSYNYAVSGPKDLASRAAVVICPAEVTFAFPISKKAAR